MMFLIYDILYIKSKVACQYFYEAIVTAFFINITKL